MLLSRIPPLTRLGILVGIALAVLAPRVATGAGIPLLDSAGGVHGAAKVVLAKGIVQLKITALAPLPAEVASSTPFTAHEYKAYLTSSTDPAVEIFLGDVYPNANQQAARRVALGGDVTRMGFNRIVVVAFSKNGQDAADVLTASLVP